MALNEQSESSDRQVSITPGRTNAQNRKTPALCWCFSILEHALRHVRRVCEAERCEKIIPRATNRELGQLSTYEHGELVTCAQRT